MSIASQAERYMLDLINQDRAEIGVAPLALERQLNAASEGHSDWMLATDTFSHTGAGGSNAGDRMKGAGFDFEGRWTWGENVAWQSERGEAGILDDVAMLHDALMNSPGHRANILSANFEYVGIGIEVGDFGGWDAVMVTQNFADTGAAVLLDGGTPAQALEPAPAPAPEPEPAPVANAAPVIEADTILTAKMRGAWRKEVAPSITVEDADGDAIAAFQIRDAEGGRDNFVFAGRVIDATDPVTIDADDLDMLQVRQNRAFGVTAVEIRATDGQDWGDWATIQIATLTNGDYADFA